MKHLPGYFALMLLMWACSSGKGNESANKKTNNVPDIPVMETGGKEMPNRWIDKTTGHEIVKLTRRPGNNRSFYFHNNPFLPTKDGKGDLMVFYGSTNEGNQIFTVNLQDYQIEQVTHHTGHISGEIVGPKLREVFYQSHDSVFASNVDTHKEHLVYVFPKNFQGHIASLNSDGNMLAGVWSGNEARKILKKHPTKSGFFNRLYEAHIPHTLFTIDIKTKKLTKIRHERNWLNHEQFSPKNPDLLLYAHEGPWQLVNRTWLMNVKTEKTRLMHKRKVNREINGHEFWSPDGQTIWFDLQIPRSVTFYLAGVNIKTMKERRYGLTRDEWSIHYNESPDETLFAGDGGDSTQVARAKNGMWIYLFKPNGDSLKAEKLVNMHYQNYRGLEPNVHFSPDGKWIIFRANFEGKDESYAVRIAKSESA
ncbi:MAG TPA: oligogalacturonate lyase family protein [Desulfobacteria bacterium]|nr:oligogalacturonate lyase family protein [Desulfobacteria bacterium]